jgi:HD-GYP domain-containing protein (c-di-GMP phosphodiesterase class II)
VEIRGGKTSKHAENVARLSELVARGAGLPEKEIQLISTAAILHDIGKIGTQEHLSIISPDGMTPDDFAEYSKHPARGQLLLDPIEGLRPVGWMIRSHHEKYAGGGFPDGLAGEDIPLGGRIIGYADMIDCIAQQYATNQAEHALQKTDIHIGRSLDPALQTLFHRFTSHVYLNEAGVLTKASDAGEYLIKLEKLKNGMVLSCNLYSTGGLLLLQKGERLDSRRIESLHRYHEQGQLEDLILIKKSGKATARKGVHV